MANKAAWYTASKAHPFEIDDAPMPEPGPHQLVLKQRAVAMNPADHAVQSRGILVNDFPSILGEDCAGDVVAVGPDVTRFKVGDRVVAMAADVKFGKPFSGAFQLYTKVVDDLSAAIPDNVSYIEASVFPCALCTAAYALFEEANLRLPFPKILPKPTGTVLVVWGASSSVGTCAVQMARAAGCEVIATCSAKNIPYCNDLGANAFDYKSDTIVRDIVDAFKGKQSAGVFCAIYDDASLRKCAEIASKIGGNKFLATVAPPGMPIPDNLPQDVKIGYNASTYIRESPVGLAVWKDWLSSALADGSMKCKPDPEVVGQGLEKIQDAIDLMGKGVSAKKLVVEIS